MTVTVPPSLNIRHVYPSQSKVVDVRGERETACVCRATEADYNVSSAKPEACARLSGEFVIGMPARQ